MGRFTYDAITRTDFEDRELAHLHLVIGAKVRRGESFHFSWKDDISIGDGRTTVWIHPRCSLVYRYYSNREASINSTWIGALISAANSPSGLYPVPEPPDLRAVNGSRPHGELPPR